MSQRSEPQVSSLTPTLFKNAPANDKKHSVADGGVSQSSPFQKEKTSGETAATDATAKAFALKRWNQLVATSTFHKNWDLVIRKRQTSEGPRRDSPWRRSWRDNAVTVSTVESHPNEKSLRISPSKHNENEDTEDNTAQLTDITREWPAYGKKEQEETRDDEEDASGKKERTDAQQNERNVENTNLTLEQTTNEKQNERQQKIETLREQQMKEHSDTRDATGQSEKATIAGEEKSSDTKRVRESLQRAKRVKQSNEQEGSSRENTRRLPDNSRVHGPSDRRKRATVHIQTHVRKKKSPRVKSSEYTQNAQPQPQEHKLQSTSPSRLPRPQSCHTVMSSPQRSESPKAPSVTPQNLAAVKSSALLNEHLRKRRGVSLSFRWPTESQRRSPSKSPPVPAVESDVFVTFTKPLRRVHSEKWLYSWDMPTSYVVHRTVPNATVETNTEVVVELPPDFVAKLQSPGTLLRTLRAQRVQRRPVDTTTLQAAFSSENTRTSSARNIAPIATDSPSTWTESKTLATATLTTAQSSAHLDELKDVSAPVPLHKHPYLDVSRLTFGPPTASDPRQLLHQLRPRDNVDLNVPSVMSTAATSGLVASRSTSCMEGEKVIIAGPLTHLINALVHPTLATDAFLKTFFLAHRHCLTSCDLLEKLIRRYNIKPLRGQEDSKEFAKYKANIQNGVIRALTVWVETCFSDFLNDEQLTETYTSFVQSLYSGSAHDQSFADRLHNVIVKQTTLHEKNERLLIQYAPRLHASVTQRVPFNIDFPMSSKRLTFLEISPHDLARQLTLRDFHYFRMIDINEYSHRNWTRDNREKLAPNILTLIQRFNEISYWVASEIVSTFNKKQRCVVLQRMLQLAKYCYELNNFHSLMAIYCGLNMQPVQRLHKTWKSVTKEHLAFLKAVDLLFDVTENYKFYRSHLRTIREKNKPMLPFQGIYLKTLMFIEENQDNVGAKDMLNVIKLDMLAKVYEEIQYSQRRPYLFAEVGEIQLFLATLDVMSDKALCDNSKRCEPAVTEMPHKKSRRLRKN
jgi:son of sevenless-like protein